MRGVPALDPQQLAKIAAKPLLESALALLEQGTPLPEVQALLAAAKEGEGVGLLIWLNHAAARIVIQKTEKVISAQFRRHVCRRQSSLVPLLPCMTRGAASL